MMELTATFFSTLVPVLSAHRVMSGSSPHPALLPRLTIRCRTMVQSTLRPAALTLSCSGLPTGITCGSFTNNPVNPTSSGATSSLSINVASSTAPGPYTFQVAGNPAGVTTSAATTTISLTVTSSKDSTSTSISTIDCYFVQGGTS